jgi:cation diffusion facilitator CzcD-associated flavoprotein CzcO
MESKLRVAVIGAGSSGITAGKCLLDEGIEPVLFEQTDRIGGNWVFREEESHASVYRSTFINTSREIMAYSDYPMPESLPDFPHHSHICQYFEEYVDHFDLRRRIRFETTVAKVRPSEQESRCAGGGPAWAVTVRHGGEETTETFDGVLVANGHHWDPRWPDFPGQGEFPGVMLHSHSYKEPKDVYPESCPDSEGLAGRKVVIVGIGNSAVDIAVELSRTEAEVYVSTRRGAYVIPKYLFGQPLDHIGVTRLNKMLPWSIRRHLMRWMLNAYQGKVTHWGMPQPQFSIDQTHPTISNELLGRLGHGAIRIKPNIDRFEGSEVVFEDGARLKADIVIFCTGYNISFPFFDDTVLKVESNEIALYRRVFHPDLPNLAFIGLVQPLGALMPIAEMQTRWVARVFNGKASGKARLPERETMAREMEQGRAEIRRRYVASPRHTIQVDFLEYMDEIGGLLKVKPRLWRHPRLLPALLLGPATPSQYRLDGPGRWEGAAEAIRRSFKGRKKPKVRRDSMESAPAGHSGS